MTGQDTSSIPNKYLKLRSTLGFSITKSSEPLGAAAGRRVAQLSSGLLGGPNRYTRMYHKHLWSHVHSRLAGYYQVLPAFTCR